MTKTSISQSFGEVNEAYECHEIISAEYVVKRTSFYYPDNGAKLRKNRTRCARDVTHDYTNVPGWNLKGKSKGC